MREKGSLSLIARVSGEVILWTINPYYYGGLNV